MLRRTQKITARRRPTISLAAAAPLAPQPPNASAALPPGHARRNTRIDLPPGWLADGPSVRDGTGSAPNLPHSSTRKIERDLTPDERTQLQRHFLRRAPKNEPLKQAVFNAALKAKAEAETIRQRMLAAAAATNPVAQQPESTSGP